MDFKISTDTLNKMEKMHQLNWGKILAMIWTNEFKQHGIVFADFLGIIMGKKETNILLNNI